MKKLLIMAGMIAGLTGQAMAQTPGTPETRDVFARYTIGIHHVAVPVKDLQKTVAFYTSLGFKMDAQPKLGDKQFIFMRMGNMLMEFYPSDNTAQKNGAVDHFCLEVTDIDQTFEAAKKAGYTFENDKVQINTLATFFEKGSRCFKIVGPDMEVIEFFEVKK